MVGEKLDQLLTSLAITPEDFADEINVGKSAIYKLLRGDTKKITVLMAKKINQRYPQFSVEYLRSLNKSDDSGVGENYFNSLKNQQEDEALPVDFGNYLQIPLIQQRARAGFLSGWEDPEYVQELPTILWEVDKEYKGRYVCFEVTGDSMDNDSRESIVEKDVLLCREIQRIHWTNKLHLHRWKNFVIVHREEGILIKRVLEHDTETGRLLLHSLNPLYEDQEVYMDDLIAIFNVIDIKRSL